MKRYLFCFVIRSRIITGCFLFFMQLTILTKTVFFNLFLNRIKNFFLIATNFILFALNNKININARLLFLDLATWIVFFKYFLILRFLNIQKIFITFFFNFVFFSFTLYLSKHFLFIKYFINKYFLLFKDKFNKLPFDIPYI